MTHLGQVAAAEKTFSILFSFTLPYPSSCPGKQESIVPFTHGFTAVFYFSSGILSITSQLSLFSFCQARDGCADILNTWSQSSIYIWLFGVTSPCICIHESIHNEKASVGTGQLREALIEHADHEPCVTTVNLPSFHSYSKTDSCLRVGELPSELSPALLAPAPAASAARQTFRIVETVTRSNKEETQVRLRPKTFPQVFPRTDSLFQETADRTGTRLLPAWWCPSWHCRTQRGSSICLWAAESPPGCSGFPPWTRIP